jgi:hypothetical protein
MCPATYENFLWCVRTQLKTKSLLFKMFFYKFGSSYMHYWINTKRQQTTCQSDGDPAQGKGGSSSKTTGERFLPVNNIFYK